MVQDKVEHIRLAAVVDPLAQNIGTGLVHRVARSPFEDRHMDLAVAAGRRLRYIELLFVVPKTGRGAVDSRTWRWTRTESIARMSADYAQTKAGVSKATLTEKQITAISQMILAQLLLL